METTPRGRKAKKYPGFFDITPTDLEFFKHHFDEEKFEFSSPFFDFYDLKNLQRKLFLERIKKIREIQAKSTFDKKGAKEVIQELFFHLFDQDSIGLYSYIALLIKLFR